MIGLCRGLAKQAYKQTTDYSDADIEWLSDDVYFGLVLREEAGVYPMEYQTSSRYYQLIDACRLRMRQ